MAAVLMKFGLNLCSGQRPFHSTGECDWFNVDIQPEWNPDIIADVSNMPMFENGSVDMIVIHQGLEHFGCGEAQGMLKECYRILRSGGSLIVTTPDLKALALAWLDGRLSDQVYCTALYGAYMGDEADRHRWNFTRKTLAATLFAAAPWSKLIDYDGRDIPGASIAMDFWILAVEVTK